jgi:prepilin-type N-terminal cleavage/methylation domain-containing protein
MFARIRDARENESGFTLVELLIVIVILGVLSGIVVFSVSGISDRGTASACKANLSSVKVASEAFYAKGGTYAADLTGLSGFLQSTTVPDVVYTYKAPTAPTIVSSEACLKAIG